jgi:hypothetical protein
MKEIDQIRKLSLWIFFVPFLAVNLCLFISTNHHLLENTFFSVDQIGRSYGFPFPYFDGSLSISRASRTFPQFLIFKPCMILTGILLIYYWKKNNSLINILNKTTGKKYKFTNFGVLSAIFLMIHSIFLGIEIDINIFKLLRRIVLLGFIIFEIIAQGILVYNFYKLKDDLKKLSNEFILKIKICLVSVLAIVAILSLPILTNSGNVHFKHALEWNYFLGVIFFYLLTRVFWKKFKTANL